MLGWWHPKKGHPSTSTSTLLVTVGSWELYWPQHKHSVLSVWSQWGVRSLIGLYCFILLQVDIYEISSAWTANPSHHREIILIMHREMSSSHWPNGEWFYQSNISCELCEQMWAKSQISFICMICVLCSVLPSDWRER